MVCCTKLSLCFHYIDLTVGGLAIYRPVDNFLEWQKFENVVGSGRN